MPILCGNGIRLNVTCGLQAFLPYEEHLANAASPAITVANESAGTRSQTRAFRQTNGHGGRRRLHWDRIAARIWVCDPGGRPGCHYFLHNYGPNVLDRGPGDGRSVQYASGCGFVWRLRRTLSESLGWVCGPRGLLVFRCDCDWLGARRRRDLYAHVVPACSRRHVDDRLWTAALADQSIPCRQLWDV